MHTHARLAIIIALLALSSGCQSHPGVSLGPQQQDYAQARSAFKTKLVAPRPIPTATRTASDPAEHCCDRLQIRRSDPQSIHDARPSRWRLSQCPPLRCLPCSIGPHDSNSGISRWQRSGSLNQGIQDARQQTKTEHLAGSR